MKVKENYERQGKVRYPRTDLGWVKPFYIELKGKLMACRFTQWTYDIERSVVYGDGVMADGNEFHSALCFFNDFVFAIDLIACGNNELDGKKFYIKDRGNNVEKGMNVLSYTMNTWLGMLMGDFEYTELANGTCKRYVRWYWDGVKACEAQLCIDGLTYTNKDGLRLHNLKATDKYGGKLIALDTTYSTKEECEEENEINVIDFADEASKDDEGDEVGFVAVFLPKGKIDAFIEQYTDMGYEAHLVEMVKV